MGYSYNTFGRACQKSAAYLVILVASSVYGDAAQTMYLQPDVVVCAPSALNMYVGDGRCPFFAFYGEHYSWVGDSSITLVESGGAPATLHVHLYPASSPGLFRVQCNSMGIQLFPSGFDPNDWGSSGWDAENFVYVETDAVSIENGCFVGNCTGIWWGVQGGSWVLIGNGSVTFGGGVAGSGDDWDGWDSENPGSDDPLNPDDLALDDTLDDMGITGWLSGLNPSSQQDYTVTINMPGPWEMPLSPSGLTDILHPFSFSVLPETAGIASNAHIALETLRVWFRGVVCVVMSLGFFLNIVRTLRQY